MAISIKFEIKIFRIEEFMVITDTGKCFKCKIPLRSEKAKL
jgi:hypothetical protein